MYRRLTTLAFSLAALPAMAANGRVPLPNTTVYATPITISAPGSYVVTRNLFPTGVGPIISIAVPGVPGDVTIDLNGFLLDNSANPAFPVIDIVAGGGAEVTIKNGTLRGGSAGIQKLGFPNRKVVIEDVTISEFSGTSGGGAAEAGIYLVGPAHVAIRRCVIRDFNGGGGLGAGISIAGGGVAHGVIEGNQIQNTSDGIVAMLGSSLEISNNQITGVFPGPVGAGIHLGACTSCLVAQNTVSLVGGISSTGIRVDGGRACKLYNNVVGRVGQYGIHLTTLTANTLVVENVVQEAGSDGILVEGSQNHIDRNVLNGNGTSGTGFGLHFGGVSIENYMRGNVGTGNSGGACPGFIWSAELCDDAGPIVGPPNWSFGDNLMPGAAGPI